MSSTQPKKTIIIHLSDTHIGGNLLRMNLNTFRTDLILNHLSWFYCNIWKHRKKKNYYICVCHTGDIADKTKYVDQTTRVFVDFTTKMKKTFGERFRFYFSVGNHDLGSGAKSSKSCIPLIKKFSAFGDNSKSFYVETKGKGVMQSVEKFNGMNYILLNSMATTIGEFFAAGGLGKRQLTWLNEQLKIIRGKKEKAVVLLHHHPFCTKLPGIINLVFEGPKVHVKGRKKWHGMNDGDEFLDLIKKNKDVLTGVLFGHRHWREFVVVKEFNDKNYLKPFLLSAPSTTGGSNERGKGYFRFAPARQKIIDILILKENHIHKHQKWQFWISGLRSYNACLQQRKRDGLEFIQRFGVWRNVLTKKYKTKLDGIKTNVDSINRLLCESEKSEKELLEVPKKVKKLKKLFKVIYGVDVDQALDNHQVDEKKIRILIEDDMSDVEEEIEEREEKLINVNDTIELEGFFTKWIEK